MLKHIYKLLGLIIIFSASLWFFSRNIEEIKMYISNEKVEMSDETFPILTLETQGNEVNRLFGYSGSLPANVVRESITVINDNKTAIIHIQEKETKINKLSFEVRSVVTNELLLSDSIAALENSDEGKKVTLKLDTPFDVSTEYALKITLVTDVSKKIHYYTRLKYYSDRCFLEEKLAFVKEFHDMTINKSTEVATYIEPNAQKEDSSFAFVDINSSFETITWGELKPVVITDIIPTVKEINIESGAIELAYYAEAETATGNETYYVKEYYRVRHTKDRMYLLWFERSVEAEFRSDLISLNKNQLKFGITNGEDIQITSNDAVTKVAFTRNGDIYAYDLLENRLSKVYSQYINKDDFDHEIYRQQDAHVINIDEEGNVNFIVYGYMPHGSYEGKVAVVLYRYHITENAIEELLYIPFQTTYQILKENFEPDCYLNGNDVFYFTIEDKIYSYNLISEKLECLAESLQEGSYKIIPETHTYVWATMNEDEVASQIHILDLETEKEILLDAPEKKYLKLIGVVGSNIVYGTGKKSDITSTTDGANIYALQSIDIVNSSGNVVKTYQKKNEYIIGTRVENNVVYIERGKKNNNGSFSFSANDNIINRTQEEQKSVELTSRITDQTMTEWYLAFPQNFVIEELPKVISTNMFVTKQEKSLYLEETEDAIKYYVYAKGEIKMSSSSAAEAIQYANEEQGVVINSRNQTVWERGGKFLSKVVPGLTETVTSTNISSIDACAYILLRSDYQTMDINEFAGKNHSMMDILEKYMVEPVNLTGCTLDEVLYFVSAGKPVIAMRDSNQAVLITAYTSSTVTIYNPLVGSSETMFLTKADRMFETAGNIFVCYMKGESKDG